MSWTWFDFAVIGVVGLSGLLAMARGFVKELISLAGWIIAAIVTFMTYKLVSGPVQGIVKSQTIADIGSGIVIFIVVLVIWGLLTHWFVKRLPGGTFGFVDGILGLVFGLARGALLVVLAYLLLQVAFKDAMPEWVTKAKTKEYLDEGAKFLQRVNPEDWLERGRKAIEDHNKKTTP